MVASQGGGGGGGGGGLGGGLLHSSHPFLDLGSIHTHSQTRPLRNYVIIT